MLKGFFFSSLQQILSGVTCWRYINNTELLTFVHSIGIPLQLTVLHARYNVKQRKNLLLIECNARGHHETAREITVAVIYDCVVPRVAYTGKKDTRVSTKTEDNTKTFTLSFLW